MAPLQCTLLVAGSSPHKKNSNRPTTVHVSTIEMGFLEAQTEHLSASTSSVVAIGLSKGSPSIRPTSESRFHLYPWNPFRNLMAKAVPRHSILEGRIVWILRKKVGDGRTHLLLQFRCTCESFFVWHPEAINLLARSALHYPSRLSDTTSAHFQSNLAACFGTHQELQLVKICEFFP
mmetsp:Transcript_74080/g.162121  ORF Transcript_74080/g.162121 Transcript_74080/m.162121 type:complete len:177 (+) Transcript_74080:475-1005(+)